MKKLLLFTTLLIVSNLASAQYTTIVKAAEERNKPKEYIEYFENGNTALKSFKDKDGNLTGKTTLYFENGNKRAEGMVENGNKQGQWSYFKENRGIESTETYLNGVLHGPYKEYYDISNYKTQGQFSNGKKDGIWRHYFENDQKLYEYYKDDNMYKLEHFYANSNIIMLEGDITNGIGQMVKYTKEGKKESEGKYDLKDKIKLGEWKYYDENGNLTKTDTYKFGKLVSTEKVEEKHDDYDDTFYWSESPISKEDIENAFKETASVRNFQLQSIDEIKNNSDYFGSNNSTTHSFKIFTDENTRKIYALLRYESDKVYYEGRYYYNVLYDVQIIFDDVYEVYQNGDKIEFVFYEDYGFLRRAKPQGENWSEYVKNEFNFSITIYDDDIREETLKNFKYLVENPIMKRE